jgi:hypothetical protein
VRWRGYRGVDELDENVGRASASFEIVRGKQNHELALRRLGQHDWRRRSDGSNLVWLIVAMERVPTTARAALFRLC